MSASKTKLIEGAATGAELTKVSATKAIDAFLGAIGAYAAEGEKVIIHGFGTFEMKTRKAREGRNMRTGETIQIPAKTYLAFKPAKPKA